MLIVSQNLTNYDIDLPKDVIYRINLAWINDLEILKKILKTHSQHSIFLDLPKNRTKPPNNKYSMDEIKPILENFPNIKYFLNVVYSSRTLNFWDNYNIFWQIFLM